MIIVVALLFGKSISVSAQAVHKGSIITDAYYGFPNLFKVTLKATYLNGSGNQDPNLSNIDFGSVGPTGLRAEYMISDKLGIGTDTWYSSTSLQYDRYDEQDTATYTDKISFNRFSTLLAFNIHFGDGEKLDIYSSFGVGYAKRTLKFETTDPNYLGAASTGLTIPISVRIGLGFRYFPIPQVGFSAALGLGGPLISLGVVGKFL